jgi:glycosyltransferase involved in cell wall biosynthesis
MRLNLVMGFFLPVPPVAGGATEKSWYLLAREFAARGHEVTVYSRHWRGWPDHELRDGVRHVRLPGSNHTRSLARNLLLDFLWSLRVSRRLGPADITVAHCVALPLWLGRLRKAGKVVLMCGRMPKGQYRRYRRIDRVLAVSAPVRDAILAENPGLAPTIRISGYPIRWGELAAAGPARPEGAPLSLGFIGRLHPEKGLDLLAAALVRLAALPGLPAWRVMLCGPQEIAEGGAGPAYVDQLRRQLAPLPAGTWEIRPPVYAEPRLQALYRGLDIFCYPSTSATGETFGVAVAEAMAAGAVPVVSDLACFRELVRDGENGRVFDHAAPDAAERLATVLAALLLDPAHRRELAARARPDVARFDFPAYAEELLRDFSTLK